VNERNACENGSLAAFSADPMPTLPGMVGASPAFSTLQRQIARIACTDAPVLIEGETGVGKELVARAIHYLSARNSNPFVPLNCGAIPDGLIESELFGHARGAFTDARTARAGVVAQAHGGTLMLDEIDTLPGRGQAAVLRFLQERTYRPVGETAERKFDGRVITATNQSLCELVERGAFRRDLMYRLDIIRLRVPPLRERRSDLVPLVRHFLDVFRKRYELPARPLHAACWNWMLHHDWPGNIRELESVVHRGVLLSEGDRIEFEEARQPAARNREDAQDDAPADFQRAKADAIEAFERNYLKQLLAQTRGNISAAARLACKERRALGKLIKKHGLSRHVH
jgi:DNA-binding NtrC family response regulator